MIRAETGQVNRCSQVGIVQKLIGGWVFKATGIPGHESVPRQ